VLCCRIRHCTGSSQSTGDSTSDSNGEDAENKTLPGSAIRAKKTAAVKEEEQVKQERSVSISVQFIGCHIHVFTWYLLRIPSEMWP